MAFVSTTPAARSSGCCRGGSAGQPAQPTRPARRAQPARRSRRAKTNIAATAQCAAGSSGAIAPARFAITRFAQGRLGPVACLAHPRSPISRDLSVRSSARGQRRGRFTAQRSIILSDFGVSRMTKRIRAKHKIDRRLGENIWGRPKSPLNKRESRPGQHGERRRRSCPTTASSCGPSRSSRATTPTSTSGSSTASTRRPRRLKGSTSEHLIGLLERRLDAVVYRAKFVPTVFAARQFVSHGHVTVNGRRVTIPSYRCRVGDVVEVQGEVASR